MIFPIRCFSCGKPINGKYPAYLKEVARIEEEVKRRKEGERKDSESDVVIDRWRAQQFKIMWDTLGITRYCCMNIFITHVELIDKLIKYKQVPRVVQ